MRRGGAKRRGGVDQEIDFLEQPPRRFAAPRLDQGGEFAVLQFIHTFYDRAYSLRRSVCVSRSQVLFQKIAAKVIFQIAPDRMDVVAIILRVVELDQE